MTLTLNKEEMAIVKRGLHIMHDSYGTGADYGWRYGDENLSSAQKARRFKRENTMCANKLIVTKGILTRLKGAV